jgi:CRP-like cAMP-binding protein
VLQRLVATSTPCVFQAGDIVLSQGTRTGHLHFIVEGAFKVTSVSVSGDSVALAVMGPNEVIGELAFLDGGEHSATVTALVKSATLRVTGQSLEEVTTDFPSTRVALARVLTARLRRLSSVSHAMVTEDIAARLARQLLDLADRFGRQSKLGVRIELPLSQREFAELVGATRERVNQVLRRWSQQGYVTTEGKRVTVLRREELRRVAHLSV